MTHSTSRAAMEVTAIFREFYFVDIREHRESIDKVALMARNFTYYSVDF
jgi:hypothetical protein